MPRFFSSDGMLLQRTKEEAFRKYREILDRIRFLRVDFLRNCPEESRPKSVKEERTYGCIVPKGHGRAEVLYLVAVPEKEMVIERYAETGERSSISLDAERPAEVESVVGPAPVGVADPGPSEGRELLEQREDADEARSGQDQSSPTVL